MDFSTIASIIGLSSLISVSVNIIFGHIEKRKMLRFEKVTEEKRRRYQATLGFMLIILNIKNLAHVEMSGCAAALSEEMNETSIKEYFIDELEAHYSFSYLYASDEILKSLRSFIDDPIKDNYHKVASAMRKDLWS